MQIKLMNYVLNICIKVFKIFLTMLIIHNIQNMFDHHFIVKTDYHLCKMQTKNNTHLYQDETLNS